jgi:hypothetical protein
LHGLGRHDRRQLDLGVPLVKNGSQIDGMALESSKSNARNHAPVAVYCCEIRCFRLQAFERGGDTLPSLPSAIAAFAASTGICVLSIVRIAVPLPYRYTI